MAQHFDAFLRLGAMARTLLLQAAAENWQVPVGESRAQLGVVHYNLSGQRLFGIDVALPGMLHAAYVKAPAFGARVRLANLDEVRSQPGVLDAFIVDAEAAGQDLQGLLPGVAIVAESTWAAQRARRVLQVTWDEGPHLAVSRESWQGHLRQAQQWFDNPTARTTSPVLRRDGDVSTALAQAACRVAATYRHPFLPHATMEPQNATAWWRGGRIELWAPTQHPAGAESRVARLLGIQTRKVTLHMTRCGGGFGRRLDADPVLEAAVIARRGPRQRTGEADLEPRRRHPA